MEESRFSHLGMFAVHFSRHSEEFLNLVTGVIKCKDKSGKAIHPTNV